MQKHLFRLARRRQVRYSTNPARQRLPGSCPTVRQCCYKGHPMEAPHQCTAIASPRGDGKMLQNTGNFSS